MLLISVAAMLASCGSGYIKSNTTFILPVRESNWWINAEEEISHTTELTVWTGVQYGNGILYSSGLDKNMISVKQVTRDSVCVRK